MMSTLLTKNGALTDSTNFKGDLLVESFDVERGTGQRPIVKHNICFIVAGIIINDQDDVLMVQEAKPSCYGKWYLPAGRMEPNETIVEGVKREVLEEAGLEFEPISVLCIEESGGYWVRIALIGKAVGGKLKTTAEADKESLQAMWWNRNDEIPIRCKDILPLIELGMDWKHNASARRRYLLPTVQDQSLLFLRILTVQFQGDEHFSVLLRKAILDGMGEISRIPTSRLHLSDRSFYRAAECLLDEILVVTGEPPKFKVLGVLSLEHSGQSAKEKDGMALTIVISLMSDTIVPCQDRYKWWGNDNIPDKGLASLLTYGIHNNNLTPLRSLGEKL